MNIINGMRN